MTRPDPTPAHQALAAAVITATGDVVQFVELWLDTCPPVSNEELARAVSAYRDATGVRQSDGLARYQRNHPLHQQLWDTQALLERALRQLGIDPVPYVNRLGSSQHETEPVPWA
jgi:hypothetical protein